MGLKPKTRYSPIGLDLGNRWIKAVQLGGSGRRLAVVASLERVQAAEPDVPITEAEVGRLCEVLRRRGFVGRKVVTAVPAGVALTSILELPPRSSGAPVAQIAETEMAHVHRREPGTIEFAYWDVPQPACTIEGTQVMAAACPHEQADALLGVLEAAGLEVIGLDLEGWAISRACGPILEEEKGVVAAGDIGWGSAKLVLLHQGIVVYEGQVSGGGLQTLSDEIQRDHGFDDPVIDYLLREVGFDPELSGEEDDWRLLLKARSHLESHFEKIAEELRLSMSYAQHQYPDAPVKRLLLVGGGAAIPGLGAHLSMGIEAQATPVAPVDVLEAGGLVERDARSASLTLAAGLALFDVKEAA